MPERRLQIFALENFENISTKAQGNACLKFGL